jgi:hypothetical protein
MRNSARGRVWALATVTAVSLWSIAGAAVADPKPDHVDHGQHLGQDKHHHASGTAKNDGKRAGHGNGHATSPSHGQGHGNSHGNGHGNGQGNGNGQAHGNAAGHQDPPGNNGTVKIAGPGDEVGHPSNNPHPGCSFVVEWFGFDEGRDVVSTVSFAAQAPTADVVLGGTSPAQVFVGGDAASGGTDLDGRQAYTLTFSGGAPHPKQGYHVKLTVSTPRSLGNDTKTKVFWVEPCDAGRTSSGHGGGGPRPHGDRGASSHDATAAADRGVEADTATVPAASGDEDAAVPTAVDAGEGNSALPEWARSPLPLTLIALGLVLAAVGIVLRNRSRA